MTQLEALGAWDYGIIALTMLVSVSVGLYFHFTGTRQRTTTEFLMAGRNMGRFPVIFSLVVTKLSAIAIIGEPADIYLYGTQRCIAFVFIFVGCAVTAYVFLPVYFAVGASTIYEYLVRRFGRKTRRAISFLGYIQTLLNMSIVIYTPAIAMSAVTEITVESSLLLIGGVCILFSALGGLKAVMWADVFQALMMYACLFALLAMGLYEAGGPSQVYKAAYEGQRMEFFKFSGDSKIPYTFWNSLSYGIQFEIAHSVNQFEVQRLLAVKSLKDSQSAALWSSIPSFVMGFLTTTAGLTLFAIFRNCDPLDAKSGIGLTKADQIVPYYIVSRLVRYPGLAGLCISGILCASISSLSSALNSLSTVFVEDFINASSCSPSKTARLRLDVCAKVLVIIHGITIVGLAFVTSEFTSILQAVVVLDGMVLGPTLGVYILGVSTERTNESGILVGLTIGALFSAWFGLGSSLFGNKYEGIPFSNEGCSAISLNSTEYISALNLTNNGTNSTFSEEIKQFFPMHRISHMWTYCIGASLTIIVAYVGSCFMNRLKKTADVDPRLLCPLVRFHHHPPSSEIEIPAVRGKDIGGIIAN